MSKFFSAFDRPACVPCNSGDTDIVEYVERIDPVSGVGYLDESGRINIRDLIMSHFEETKIDNILARCALGDISALNRVQGLYADVTGVPRTIAEAHSYLRDMENNFAQMPLEVRQEFNNDFGQYVAGFSDGRINKIVERMIGNEQKSGIAVQPDTANISQPEQVHTESHA